MSGWAPVLPSLAVVGVLSCSSSRLVPIRGYDAPVLVMDGGGVSEQDAPADPLPPDLAGVPCPQPSPVGFGAGTTGGAGTGSKTMTVTSYDALVAAAAVMDDRVVIDVGTLIEAPSGVSPIRVESNKTIRGVVKGAGLSGAGFNIFRVSNVIIQNMVIIRAAVEDAITINASNNVWIDHCDLSLANDGLADVNHGADAVTLSWNHFHDQAYTTLVGHTAAPDNVEDPGRLHVTYHHNWFHATEYYNPKVRYGYAHVFNNFYDFPAGSTRTGVISQLGATVLVEANVFQNIKTPMLTDSDDSKGDPAKMGFIAFGAENSYLDTGNSVATNMVSWNPSPSFYNYMVEDVGTVAASVVSCAGPLFK